MSGRRGRRVLVVADPGLQGERTYLAWQRTGLSFAALLGIGALSVVLSG